MVCAGDIKGLGALAQHTLVDERISFKVPDGTSLAEAATVPLASLTSYLALFSDDLLNIDRQMASGEPILIWGGSCKLDPSLPLKGLHLVWTNFLGS